MKTAKSNQQAIKTVINWVKVQHSSHNYKTFVLGYVLAQNILRLDEKVWFIFNHQFTKNDKFDQKQSLAQINNPAAASELCLNHSLYESKMKNLTSQNSAISVSVYTDLKNLRVSKSTQQVRSQDYNSNSNEMSIVISTI